VYKGGFPSKYGGRLSSVIDMTGKNGDLTRRQFGLGANLMSTQLLYETPIIWGGSWLFSYRRSYSDFMSSPFFDKMYEFVTGDDEVPANNRRRVNRQDPNDETAFQQQIFPTFYFYDLHNKVTFTPGNRDVISLSMYGGRDFLNESRETSGIRGRPGPGGGGGNQEDPEPLEKTLPPRWRRFISEPFIDTSYAMLASTITHFGRHDIVLFHVQTNYVLLYQSSGQNSRDLNEPYNNINGGLGMFTAFNSDTVSIVLLPQK